jgi:hypothetical protein
MNIYESTNGQFILFDGETKHFFNTESETIAMNNKIMYAEKVIDLSEALIDIIKEFPTMEKVWVLEGYLATMTDEDILSTGKTKDEISAFITFIENFTKFLTNDNTVIIASYQDTLYNLLRSP